MNRIWLLGVHKQLLAERKKLCGRLACLQSKQAYNANQKELDKVLAKLSTVEAKLAGAR